MSVVAIIQARMGSSRLPGKVLRDLAGKPMLERVVERVRKFDGLDQVIVATSSHQRDIPIVDFCRARDWRVERGSELDVLDRYYQVAKEAEAKHVLRVTADCPFLCFNEGTRLVDAHLESAADYTHNITVLNSLMPLGTGAEVFTFAALEQSWEEGLTEWYREHVDEYILHNRNLFVIENIIAPDDLRRPSYRLTVDSSEDLRLASELYRDLQRNDELIPLKDVVALLDDEPQRLKINGCIDKNEIDDY